MSSAENKTLIVITGPTASGKTALAIETALELATEIVSADSRQVFHGIPVGTAMPTADERAQVPHHLIDFLQLDDYYSASRFEEDALQVLSDIWKRSDYAVVAGGSMMYIDALCKGLDRLPTISQEVRDEVWKMYTEQGPAAMQQYLLRLDPEYYRQVDLQNHRRVVHAVEICLQAGVPYSSLRSGRKVQRPFKIHKVMIGMERSMLFDRINRRVDAMITEGLVQEAEAVYPMRHLNSLNTVGYKEMFAMIEGKMTLPEAIARMAKNTRVYAKKQLTWAKKVEDLHILKPGTRVTEALGL